MANQVFHEGVHVDILSKARANVARCSHLPLNAFKRVQLLNSIFILQCVYHVLLVLDDQVFHKLDKIGCTFVTSVKGFSLPQTCVTWLA